MRIAYDHQIFTLQTYGGISRYFTQLAQELSSLGEKINILAPIYRNSYLRHLSGDMVRGVAWMEFPPNSTRMIAMINRGISRVQSEILKSDILHETYYSEYALRGPFKCRILTVYDMIHEKFATDGAARDNTSRLKRLAVARADHIICISNSTKNDLCNIFGVHPKKVAVVHLGFDRFVEKSLDKRDENSSKPYILYVGARGGYKNFERFLRAISSKVTLKNTFDIIAFGGGAFTSSEHELINTLEFNQISVRQINGKDQDLGRLYTAASAFVYPSLYEGFGLPPLEAMAHGCPVVVSNTSSMPEVVGLAGEFFDPLDVDAQAQAICNVVFDSERRDNLIIQGKKRLEQFSWRRCALETRQIYSTLLNRSISS